MGYSAKDWFVFMLAGIAGAVLLLTGLSGTAAAATEPEYSLAASPNSISWPDAPDFQYRLHVQAGSEPLDVKLKFPDPGWGYEGVEGSIFQSGAARLDGPGKLAIDPGPVPPPIALMPGACVRGVPAWFSATRYELTLAAGASTTLILDATLTAAPLPATRPEIRASLWTAGAEPIELSAPITVGGQPGVMIRSRFVGAGAKVRITRASRQAFRLVGTTDPPLANRAIRIRAELLNRSGMPGKERQKTNVRTDEEGRFLTGAMRLGGVGIWGLKASMAKPGEFDSEPSCAGAVTVAPVRGKLSEAALNGHSFRSVKVIGRTIGQKRIRLQFFRHANRSGQPEKPTLVARAGCNSMGAGYRAANGRLRWVGPVMGTTMGCSKARMRNDRWLSRLLRKGVKAKLDGKHLTLTRGKTRIVLRQTS